jgi:hypothetical protein
VRSLVATPLADLTEKEFSAQLYELARMTGWRRYHTWRSVKSAAGFPDEVLVRERVIFVEVKREQGKVSPAQQEWLDALHAAGAEAYVWRPSNLEEAARVLTHRQKKAA